MSSSRDVYEELMELREQGWVTSKEAALQGVPEYMVYRWGETLEKKGLAQKLDVPPKGLWLVSQRAITFLRTRKGKVGRPKRKV